jgi:hypothetical protein
MNHVEIAKKLFDWNQSNLTHSAKLKKSEIADYFAGSFQVKANGRNYSADHDSYFDFLNQFRSTIRSISYELQDFITDPSHVIIPLTAHIIRIDGTKEKFEAILILKFNQYDRIVLWQEVYVKL